MRCSVLLLPGLVLLGVTNAAAAASCLDEMKQIATRYDLHLAGEGAGLRGATSGSGTSAGEPAGQDAQSLGTSDPGTRSRAPPSGGIIRRNRDAAPATGSQADPQHLTVASRSDAEALLDEARTAEAEGKPEECYRRLRDAQTLLSGGDG